MEKGRDVKLRKENMQEAEGKVRVIEHDRARRRPEDENRFEVLLKEAVFSIFKSAWALLENRLVPEIKQKVCII